MRQTFVPRVSWLVLATALLSCGGDGGGGSAGAGGGAPTGSGGTGGRGGSGGSPGTGGAGGGAGAGGSGPSSGADASAGTGGGGAGPDAPARVDAGGVSDGRRPDGGSSVDTGLPAAPPFRPFGSRPMAYPAGVIRPSGGQAALDQAVRTYYNQWRARYLVARCGGFVIVTDGGTGASAGTFTVAEGHGYGMIVTAMMAGHDPRAREYFDGLYTVFRKFPSVNSPDLMCSEILGACGEDEDGEPLTCVMVAPGCFRAVGHDDSATDGDLDIAFALLLADKQWGSTGAINYRAEALKVITAIKTKEMNATTHLPEMGDWQSSTPEFAFGSRPSDFMNDHFRAYGQASNDPFWTEVVTAISNTIETLQIRFAPQTGLVPDFIVRTNVAPAPAPAEFLESVTDGEYGYNSCRVPWRLTTDFVVTGDARTKTQLQRINTFIRTTTAGNPARIQDGYKLNGTAGSDVSGPDLSFTAPFAVSAIVDPANQAWLDALWQATVSQGPDLYFGDTIKMIGMLVITGNWWAP